MIIYGIIFGLMTLAAIFFTMLKYYQLWKRLEFPGFLYWIIQAVLFTMLILCCGGIPLINNEIIKSIMLRISAIYLVMLVYSTFLMLLRQIVCLIGNHFSFKSRFFLFVKSTKRGAGSIFVITFLLGAASLFQMQYMTYTDYEVTTKQQQGGTLKIAAISDAHIGTAVLRSDLPELVEKVNKVKPDVIFLVGDMFDNSTTESLRQASVSALSKLQAPYGVYYVEGNHEVYLHDDTTNYFRKAGIQVLLDQVAKLPNGIQIAGRRDLSDRKHLPLDQVLSGVDNNKPIILLSHQPLQFYDAARQNVDLVLSGHTHGGQLWGNIGTYLTNDMNYGIKKFSDMTAITSSGIGGWGVPAKLGWKSEIVVIDYKY